MSAVESTSVDKDTKTSAVEFTSVDKDTGNVVTIKYMDHPQIISLKHRVLLSASVIAAIISQIAEYLKSNNCVVTTLEFANCKLGSSGAKIIAEALLTNDTIEIIDLSNNFLGDAGAIEIAKALIFNKRIEEVYLARNNIGLGGVEKIANALKINHAVQTIDLSNNCFMSNGAIKIAEALILNKQIRRVYLSRNLIHDGGAKEIENLLRINKSIEDIRLNSNIISLEGQRGLLNALKFNFTLQNRDHFPVHVFNKFTAQDYFYRNKQLSFLLQKKQLQRNLIQMASVFGVKTPVYLLYDIYECILVFLIEEIEQKCTGSILCGSQTILKHLYSNQKKMDFMRIIDLVNRKILQHKLSHSK